MPRLCNGADVLCYIIDFGHKWFVMKVGTTMFDTSVQGTQLEKGRIGQKLHIRKQKRECNVFFPILNKTQSILIRLI